VETPDGRTLAAGEFAEAAERLHLMHEIDLEVSRQVFQRCARLLGNGAQHPGFAHFVNLSPQFLARRKLVDEMVANAMHYCRSCSVALTPIRPIVFEITERQYIHHLAKLPVDFIKIEGWMIRAMLDDAKARGLVRSLVAMAREQGIKTIAESVETEATALMLQEFGVDWAQGHYFGTPHLDSSFAA
jgi:EAL domain-containing protein (putative c-di-GMP-specific phosphodiesterase class I)